MKKIDYAVFLASHLYGCPIDMMPETHKEVRAYMRLSKAELKLKFDAIEQPTTDKDAE